MPFTTHTFVFVGGVSHRVFPSRWIERKSQPLGQKVQHRYSPSPPLHPRLQATDSTRCPIQIASSSRHHSPKVEKHTPRIWESNTRRKRYYTPNVPFPSCYRASLSKRKKRFVSALFELVVWPNSTQSNYRSYWNPSRLLLVSSNTHPPPFFTKLLTSPSNATELIQGRVEALRKELDCKPHNPKTLQQVLQGSVLVTVNLSSSLSLALSHSNPLTSHYKGECGSCWDSQNVFARREEV